MTAANFTASVLPFTLCYEGGAVDDPRDPGGRTNQGITQRTYDAYRARTGQGARDVFDMPEAERDAIYRSGFWNAVKGDTLPDGVDLVLFDFGVNSGPARALKAYARRTSNDTAETVELVCAARLSFLHALGTFRTFGRGWTARVAACEAVGLKMAEHARIGVPVEAPASTGTATKLAVESKAAAARVRRHKRRATAVTTLAGAGAAAQSTAVSAVHLPAGALPVLGVGLAASIALLFWRAHQQQARADALGYVARGGEIAPTRASAGVVGSAPIVARP